MTLSFPRLMPDWDKIFKEHGYLFVDPHEDISRIIELFHRTGIRRVLDLGCGTGRHLVYLSRNNFDVYGFDSSSHALVLADKWLKEERLAATIRVHHMEQSFPYPASFFDAVISIQVIHHNLLRDVMFTIKEIDRVLRSGGYIFITVPVFGPKPDNSDDDWNLSMIEKGTFIPQSGPESGIPHHYFTEDELLTVFEGFQKIELYRDRSNHRCLLGRKK